MNGFKGKVVLVAGGTGGLGRAVSLAFLAEQADLLVTYRNKDEWSRLQSTAGPAGPRLTGHRVDVTDEKAVRQMVERIHGDKGRLDVVVNAVGGYAGGVPAWDQETRILDQMLELNLRPGWMLARAAAGVMRQQGSGIIVNVAGRAAVDHAAGASAYAASKAAAVAMLDSLAADLAGSGVRINSVLPSIIDTPANRHAMPGADFTKWPKPEDIARVILFLCSDAGRVIHGAAIPVYGNA